MKVSRVLSAAIAMACSPLAAHGQLGVVVSGPGWEAFPGIEYQGGDASAPKKLEGALVLTDSTLSLHECTVMLDTCKGSLADVWFKPRPLWTIPLRQIVNMRTSHFPLTARFPEELVIVYETASSAEAPVFRTQFSQPPAIEAKIRFRLKKLGVTLPP